MLLQLLRLLSLLLIDGSFLVLLLFKLSLALQLLRFALLLLTLLLLAQLLMLQNEKALADFV